MTLIELMVAVLMALFMATALLFVYVGMRNSYLSQDRLAQLQDNQRVAQTLLSGAIEQAGYFVNPKTDTAITALTAAQVSWPDSSTSAYVAGQLLQGFGNGSGSGTQSDAISVRFQTANTDGILNCTGGTNTSGANLTYINTFTINGNNELTCAVNGATAVPLVSNIGRMRILYGTDTKNTGAIDAYLPSGVVNSNSLWARVRSVKIFLFFMDNSQSPPVMFPNPVLQTICLQNTQ